MLAVTGYRSKIVEELRKLLPSGEEVVRIDHLPSSERYFLCAGLLQPMRMMDMEHAEISATMWVNCFWPVEICERVLATNDHARICVMGSESGFTWSHNDAYAGAKAALHRYVETKKLKPNQQLVCVAPSVISDAGMTLRRTDTDNLERRRLEHPKQRFITSAEVARMVHFLLYVDDGYTTGTVIRMNGGGR